LSLITKTRIRGLDAFTSHQPNPPRRSEERPASARQLYDGSDCPDSDSLQRRRSRGKLSDSASTPSASQATKLEATPWRLQSLLIRGGGAPDVHASLVTGGGQGPTPAIAGSGGTAPERTGERVSAVNGVGSSCVFRGDNLAVKGGPNPGPRHKCSKVSSSCM
jgi:hypothetical protein